MNASSSPGATSLEPRFAGLLANPDASPEALLAGAREALLAKRAEFAASLAQRALERGAPAVPAIYFLGLAKRAAGEWAAARASFEQALKEDPPQLAKDLRVELLDLSAQCAQQLGDFGAAASYWQSALALQPDQAKLWNNWGVSCRALGREEDAERALREALRLDSNYARAWGNLGELLAARFDLLGAIDAQARAAALDTQDFGARYQLGRCYVQLNRYAEAVKPLAEAVALAPEHVEALRLYAGVLGEVGERARARDMHQLLADRHPRDWKAQIASRLGLPDIPASWDEIRASRKNFGEGLAQLQRLADAYRPQPGERFEIAYSTFALAYQGENDRSLQAAWAKVLETLADQIAPQLRAPLPRRGRRKRLRVGFVSSMLRAHTVGHYFGAWLTDLDPRRFEIYYYNLYRGDDAVVQALTRSSTVTRRLGSSPQAAAETIRGDELDALIFTDVGMDHTVSVLPAFRLAPLQLAAWGHPVTTGFGNVDAFLSCEPMEPANFKDHYLESVILLAGIGTRYALPPLPPPAAREAFGLPADRPLYLLPQSLFKVHPDNDPLICELLERDPSGIVLMFQDPAPAKTQAFVARLARTMQARGIPPRGQLKFLPRTDALGFRALLQMADVVLDTLHWSGGNTSLDALAVGSPWVTLPGEFMRGRQSAAMARIAGVEDLVARDRADYLQRALRIAHEADYRRDLQRRMLTGREAIFDRHEAIDALQELLLERCQDGP